MDDFVDVDSAADSALKDLEAAIDAARGIMKEREGMESADNCVVCGCEIPSERQIAIPGCDTCVQCQLKIEAHSKLFAKGR